MADTIPLHLIRKVKLLYPRMNQPYRFDNTENRSVPCGAFDDGAKYETKFVMTKDQAKALYKEMSVAYDAKKEKSWGDFAIPFDKEDDGTFTFKTSIKAAYGTDATRLPPLYDAGNTRLPEDFLPTTDSVVNIAVRFVPYKMGNAAAGVSLRLHSVQILQHEPLKDNSPFGEEEGFTAEEPSAFEEKVVPIKPEPEKDDGFDDPEEKVEPETKPVKATRKTGKAATTTASASLSKVIDDWDS